MKMSRGRVFHRRNSKGKSTELDVYPEQRTAPVSRTARGRHHRMNGSRFYNLNGCILNEMGPLKV